MIKIATALVDFGESDGTMIPWLVEEYLPAVGDTVLMKDGEGNACYGTVSDLSEQDWLAMVTPDWDTWIPAASPLEIRTELSQGAVGGRFRVGGGLFAAATLGSTLKITPEATISYA